MRYATSVAMLLVGLTAMASPPDGMPKETREYSVIVDGKPAGTLNVRVSGESKRQTAIVQADVKVGHGVFSYAYAYRGAETWVADRAVEVEANSNDNGKKARVVAKARANGAEITVDGKAATSRAFAWTTSYWRLPAEETRKGEIAVLDVDTGDVFAGRLELVGPEQVSLASGPARCVHYRLHAKVPADLWFDGMERLMRQTYVDDGHPTEIKLVRAAGE